MLSIEIDDQVKEKVVKMLDEIKLKNRHSKWYMEFTNGKITTFEYTPKHKFKQQLLEIAV